ncbi:hypothetical protein OLMES_0476 [Oleiphilus messinensis]|uniref:DUF2252 domain-containing protein n=1 Tax=Oleiphilus messinensis TaxID=141451 RepID=A0A1Y0I2U2_9GAMM|nr:DUF2252 family protein [Oleiphilus messinensis]ARU54580.1 hypothetical protein OLMES_0476 [Oleiphilus messinensis]
MNQRKAFLCEHIVRVDGEQPGAKAPSAKHLKMANNPFQFYRGTSQLFYADLAAGNLRCPQTLTESVPLTSVMGDCHLSNFGFFTEEGAHGDTVIFAPNDFDDACVGHAVWDLLRFAVSMLLGADYGRGVLAGSYATEADCADFQSKGISRQAASDGVLAFLRAYEKTCEKIAAKPEKRMRAIEKIKSDHVLVGAYGKALSRAAGGAKFGSKSTLAKSVATESRPLRFRDLPERFERLPEAEYQAVYHQFRPYVDDEILDIVKRLGAGTGSVNMARYYLLVGTDGLAKAERNGGCISPSLEELRLCHLVEVKLQREAAPIYYFPDISPVNRLNHAHLTVDCQRHMQRKPDLVLDEALWQDQNWLIRSRHHARVGIDPEDVVLALKSDSYSAANKLIQYGKTCGKALALAHARGDRRSTRFEVAMGAQLPVVIPELLETSLSYYHQVIDDWTLFKDMLAK